MNDGSDNPKIKALWWLSQRWNIPLLDILQLIMVESSGNPRLIGGLNNQHHGLIQWGEYERNKELPRLMQRAGLNPKTRVIDVSFEKQIELAAYWVEMRAKRRNIKIRGIHDVYRVINPGAYSAQGDAFGTKGGIVLEHNHSKRREAIRWLRGEGYTGDLKLVASRPSEQNTAKVPPKTPPRPTPPHPQNPSPNPPFIGVAQQWVQQLRGENRPVATRTKAEDAPQVKSKPAILPAAQPCQTLFAPSQKTKKNAPVQRFVEQIATYAPFSSAFSPKWRPPLYPFSVLLRSMPLGIRFPPFIKPDNDILQSPQNETAPDASYSYKIEKNSDEEEELT